jgi:hypothetical protein
MVQLVRLVQAAHRELLDKMELYLEVVAHREVLVLLAQLVHREVLVLLAHLVQAAHQELLD